VPVIADQVPETMCGIPDVAEVSSPVPPLAAATMPVTLEAVPVILESVKAIVFLVVEGVK
jgi:hypothetical protein